jgi:hypothetical protein
MTENVVKIFLVDDAYVELEDAYVDKEKDLRAEVFQQIKTLCKSAKMTKVNKKLVVNLKETNDETAAREMKQDTVPLGDVNLEKYKIVHNADWIPEKMDKDEARTYTQKVGDNTWKYLELFYQIYCARIDLYNDSLEMPGEKKEKADMPECFEQVMHEQLVSALNQIIMKNIEKEFDSEFKEIGEKEEGKKPKAGARKKAKKNKKK